ncbi:pyridoxal phosphate-dependent aminotransferase [Jannaschia sp. LMIT008]|uniref:pyridoxal phosphate-dependent aminotransferase n=1 Tax=Jannaschia maritima TaxID=3032585 RepID=UPI002811844B|nr:pyridoxal phosphate-dependent aminotransferase [Jannaschia sp. LMIT008]
MRRTSIMDRLHGLGGAKWEVHAAAKALQTQGRDVIELTIGEPDVPTPDALVEIAVAAMRAGRTGYSDGQGEAGLRAALAERYARRTGRPIGPDQVMCFPGTQSALFAAMAGMAENGDAVLVGDPMYATYEGVVRATGATMIPVPLRAERGFRMDAADLDAAATPDARAVLLTTPHNPTGAVLAADDVAAIGTVARERDLWILSDEVYEDLIFDGGAFSSPLARADLADRTVVVSSISKSHAAPGFRSGWCIAPAPFVEALLPVVEAMLFGNQPFIADMTEVAIRDGSKVAVDMRDRFAARAARLAQRLAGEPRLRVHRPDAGMFVLIDVRGTGMDGTAYAHDLLHRGGVAVMPGASFGTALDGWVRVALTAGDDSFDAGIDRMLHHARDMPVAAA